ncbi:MAG TPA: tetratricopeptide repeat protein [Leptospiraceae bacterium]|nr:tetratricopeptide repeat protein [Leptospiraceae bacterium]HMZ59065.1 tetratricopeptide repeat protein [Leptospiraceae bacterium]HNF16988.1 tetratricopeptide repeat protein [Leptospiraceae bacterium]HNF25534.1 tetratricopeptide repeat protein [Leptospiraceae bacterium]HNI26513.1 tetratricopeptide repeat protein [Leptospiraceae bacterium]
MKKIKIFAAAFCLSAFGLSADGLSDSYTFEAKKDYAKALESMEGMARDNAGDYFVQLRTAWLALIRGEFAKSSGYYQKATLIAPNAIEPRLGQIRALMGLGQYKQSEIAIKALLKLDSKNYYARSSLAYGYYASGSYAEAEKVYEGIVNDYPADTEMQIGLGWSLLKSGKKPRAKEIFTKLIKIVPYEERVTSGLHYSGK